MPTYEYKCLDCGHRFDVFQNMSDKPLTCCEKCNGAVKRLIGSGAGIIFKGTGFYCTDYKKSSVVPATGGDGSGTTGSKSEGGSAAAENKPSAAAEKTKGKTHV
jgi:putative FmdB family regulatory protein